MTNECYPFIVFSLFHRSSIFRHRSELICYKIIPVIKRSLYSKACPTLNIRFFKNNHSMVKVWIKLIKLIRFDYITLCSRLLFHGFTSIIIRSYFQTYFIHSLNINIINICSIALASKVIGISTYIAQVHSILHIGMPFFNRTVSICIFFIIATCHFYQSGSSGSVLIFVIQWIFLLFFTLVIIIKPNCALFVFHHIEGERRNSIFIFCLKISKLPIIRWEIFATRNQFVVRFTI